MVMETEQRRGGERTPRDGEREEPQPELAGPGAVRASSRLSGAQEGEVGREGRHRWGWFSAGMVLRRKCRRNCPPRVSETWLWGVRRPSGQVL